MDDFRVIIVDDEKEICTLIRRTLLELDVRYQVATANSADEALALLTNESYHLMLTDIRMPGRDGLSLIRTVREKYPEMQFIIMTAHGNLENAIEAMQLGASNYLQKPLSVKLLHHAIQQMLDRLQLTTKLKTAEEKFQKVFRTIPDSIHITRLSDNHITDVNDSFIQLFGYDQSALAGVQSKLQLWRVPEEQKLFHERVRKDLAASNLEAEFIRKDGSIFHGLVSAHVVGLGDTDYAITVTRNITDLKFTRDALVETEGKIHRIFNNIQDAYFELSSNGEFVEISPSINKICGYSRAELIGKSNPEIWYVKDLHQQLIKEVQVTGELQDREVQLLSRDRRKIICSLNATLVYIPDTLDFRIIGSLRDITNLKRTESQLFQHHKLETIGRLAGGVAHDFNNMLTGILGYADLAKLSIEPSNPAVDYLNSLVKRTNEAAQLVEQLMTFSKRRTLDMRIFSLNDQLVVLVDFLKKLLRDDITVSTRISPRLDLIEADFHAIQEIITNISLNAETAMPDGGTLEISARNVQITENDPRLDYEITPGDFVRISIKDNGSGILEEDLPKIFDPFFTTQKIGSGTGMGLSAVFGLIQQHEGHIVCTSRKDEGTLFELYFPRYHQKNERGEPVMTSALHSIGKSILIVEDDYDILSIMKTILENENYSVVQAKNGKEALAVMKERKDIQIIISDVIMPRMSGIQLYSEVVKDNPGCHFIFISGYTSDKLPSDFPEKDAVFLQKPFSSADLLETVRGLL